MKTIISNISIHYEIKTAQCSNYPNTKTDLYETTSWSKPNVPSMLNMFGTRHWLRKRIS